MILYASRGFWIFLKFSLSFGGPKFTNFLYYSSIIHKKRHFCGKIFSIGGLTKKIIFFCQFSGADFSLVINFWVKWASIPKRAWSQLSKMAWHLTLQWKLSGLLPDDWASVTEELHFCQKFWNFRGLFGTLKLKKFF